MGLILPVRQTVRFRLVLAILGVTVIMAGPALFALFQLREARDVALELRQRHAAAGSAVGELRSALRDVDLAARGYVATGSRPARDRLARAVLATAEAGAHLEGLEYGPEADESLELVRAVRASIYQVATLVTDGALLDATRAFRGLLPLLSRAESALADLDAVVRDRSTAAAGRAERLADSAERTTTAALLIAAVLAFLVGGALATTVVRPVERLQRAMGRVADGALSPPEELDYRREDELGELNRVFAWMTERLAELDRLKSEFVSAAGHKLKTPVSVVTGYSEMIRDGEFGQVTDEQREVLGEMHGQLEELTAQIDQLMRMSRAEAGTLGLEFEDAHPEDLATALRDAFEASARQKAVDFRVVVDPEVPQTIRLDEERFRDLVLGNLLDNAFKYCDRGDTVELRIRPDDREVAFEVRDTGPGIAPDELDRIFEPYHRAPGTEGRIGTGMGLAIARQVAEGHAGTIEVESEPVRGTVFTVRLPVGPGRSRGLS